MSEFQQIINESGATVAIKTAAKAERLFAIPHLNKVSAFSAHERIQFNLLGRLPFRIETLSEQLKRSYQQFLQQPDAVQKNLFLRNLYQTNETLFYQLVNAHLEEVLPIIYTPTIAQMVEQFSLQFRRPRGLYLAYPDQDYVSKIFAQFDGSEFDIVVITDGESVLGIGDQGIGGMEICLAKLMVYVACGGVIPYRILPIQIDVGTNNAKLLNDPLYLGWRHKRVVGESYDAFIAQIVSCIHATWPSAYLHWEDFGRDNARRNLQRYRDRLCSFNDDMQGTGSVTLAALLTAVRLTNSQLTQQRVVIFGAGTAGTGIADQICRGMMKAGASQQQALDAIWLVDRQGLLMHDSVNLMDFQKPYCKSWSLSAVDLETVVYQIKPTILIGCSSVSGAFTRSIIETMAFHVTRPIIFPLSNPTEKIEASPADLLHWTKGRALIATGSPFQPVLFQGHSISIAQCNNALIYPGIGLGVIVAKARRLSDDMLFEACLTLSRCAESDLVLLPNFDRIHAISKRIALAVAEQAAHEKLAGVPDATDFSAAIDQYFWLPEYYPLLLETE